MAFIIENGTVTSFAEFNDVVDRDQRLFESNEGLTYSVVEENLERATDRILSKIRLTSWWREYYTEQDPSYNHVDRTSLPAVDPNRIQNRQQDFTDLCVYTALAQFILPAIADFSDENTSERNKMGYYENRAESLFQELIHQGDWYDFDDDGVVEQPEREPGRYNLKRVR